MIDLHLHTTASDGRCTPVELVHRARNVGITVLSATDHDTLAATSEVAACAASLGIEAVVGVEITTVMGGTDVHVLGYFVDPGDPGLRAFLRRQQEARVLRATEMVERLRALNVPIDLDVGVVGTSEADVPMVGRPHLARALVEAGHVATITEAFDRFLGQGGPANVPHHAPASTLAIDAIVGAGGVASLAHPGLLRRDDLFPELVEAGLGGLEVYHSQHDPLVQAHYRDLAARRDLAVTGGSDYHGDGSARATLFGKVGLPEEDFEQLQRRCPTPPSSGS